MRKVLSVAVAAAGLACLNVAPALADGPGVGTATVVSVGDSAISGEAARWAGNTNGSPSNDDALGPTAHQSPPAISVQSPPLGSANVADGPESKK